MLSRSPALLLGIAGGAVGGARLLLRALVAGQKSHRKRRATEYLVRISDALGDEDRRRLAAELASDPGGDAWEHVESGYQQMMAAIHEDAKRCIAVVVADYIRLQTLPDREYQLAGGLLAQCDRPMLDGLPTLTDGYQQLKSHARGAKLGRGHGGAWWAGGDDSAASGTSAPFPWSDAFPPLLRSLVRFEYGDEPEDRGRTNLRPPNGGPKERGAVVLLVHASPHGRRWQHLSDYVAPIRSLP